MQINHVQVKFFRVVQGPQIRHCGFGPFSPRLDFLVEFSISALFLWPILWFRVFINILRKSIQKDQVYIKCKTTNFFD